MAIMKDGFKTLITFAAQAGVEFCEKEVTPPGLDGGGEIDTTCMKNVTLRTKSPKSLITLTESSITASYDPLVYNKILSLINVNNLITITFPDGETIKFWGWLNTFTPGDNVEGEQPTAEITLIPSNVDNSDVEQLPVIS